MADRGSTAFRPFWSGTITFGLVSVPVALLPANRPRSVSLRMLSPDGTPLARRYFCPEDDREVDRDEIVRGYEIEDGKFVIVTDDELDALEPRKSRDIDLRIFVDRSDIDPVYFQRAYFLVPGGDSSRAYKLLADVMERNNRAGIATFVMRGKEYLVAILADHGILRAETMRYADEIRDLDQFGLGERKKPKPAEVKRFRAAIRKERGKVEVQELEDDYAGRLMRLVEKKRKKGEDLVEVSAAVESEDEEGGGEVIDLMAVLKQSLGASATRRPARKAKPRSLPLEDLSKEQLYEKAKKLKIPGRSRMNRDELLEAVGER